MSVVEPRSWCLRTETIRAWVASFVLTAPLGCYVTVEPERRSGLQNKRLHAMLGDVVKSGYELHGETYDIEDWKTFFVSVWMGETKRSRIVPGINGEFVQLYWRTSRMTKEQLGEVMIIVERFCAERGIQLREPS